MSRPRVDVHGAGALFLRRRLENELDAGLRFHIEMEADANPAAFRSLGGVDAAEVFEIDSADWAGEPSQ